MKKINAGYEINHLEEKIILTKVFAKAASVMSNNEYSIVKQLRAENPTYTMELREIKHKAGKKSYRNLTYAHMREYIISKEGQKSLSIKELEKVQALSKVQAGQYAYVKTWFLKKYPELKKQAESDANQEEETQESTSLELVK